MYNISSAIPPAFSYDFLAKTGKSLKKHSKYIITMILKGNKAIIIKVNLQFDIKEIVNPESILLNLKLQDHIYHLNQVQFVLIVFELLWTIQMNYFHQTNFVLDLI